MRPWLLGQSWQTYTGQVTNPGSIYLWTFSGRKARELPGYHFSGTARGCAKLLHAIDLRLRGQVAEALPVVLDPVPVKALQGGQVGASYQELLLTPADETAIVDYGDALEICVTRNDLTVFRAAVEAASKGVGDFEILDGQLWFWWSYLDQTGELVVNTDPDFNPGPG